MIGIGINENAVLTGAKVNDKGSLEITFDMKESLTATKVSVFEESQTAKVTNDGRTGTTITLFGLKKPDGKRNEDKTEEELLEMIGGDIKRVKNQLTQILEQYMSNAEIKWDVYYQTDVNETNYRERYLDNAILETMFNNYATQFIRMVEPFFKNVDHAVRLKILRQSKEKNFPTFPGRFLEEQPFIETMDVPKERSRVVFTQYEKDNGLDSSAAITKAEADVKDKIEDTPEAKKSFFGQRK